MKRLAAFLMICIYLCSTTESYQLLKIPAFFTHFTTHCNDEPETTLVGFVLEHYSETVVYDADWQDDMKLPFKTCEHTNCLVQNTLRTEVISISDPIDFDIDTHFTPKLPIPYCKLQVCDIFQPPRGIS